MTAPASALIAAWVVAWPVPPFATGRVPVTWVDRLTPDSVPPSVRLPELVTVPLRVIPFTDPVPPTLVTVPVVLLVPAPMAVRKSAADRALTVLSALNLGKVIAPGLVNVKTLAPTVVAPRLVRPVAAFRPVDPPSQRRRSEKAESHSVCLDVVGIE